MPTPDYTIIIPHHNTPDLLQRCLDSIPDRADIQVIVVDDNSSPEVVDFTCFPGSGRKHTQFIFNKYSHGAGHARNLALPHATGKWLLFADADDFYTQEAWSLFGKHINSSADIIYFGITSVDSDTLQPTERYKVYDTYVQAFASESSEDDANWLRYRHDVPWGKMIRHTLVTDNQIVFGETRYCNDTLFSCRCAIAAGSIDVESEAAYCVTDNRQSLTKQQSPEAIQIRFEVICQKNNLLKENGLGNYQMPILFYTRQALQISPILFIKIVILGTKYHCSWFREIKRWLLRTPAK